MTVIITDFNFHLIIDTIESYHDSHFSHRNNSNKWILNKISQTIQHVNHLKPYILYDLLGVFMYVHSQLTNPITSHDIEWRLRF